MKHFCTLCDKSYLLKGLAMYQSLKDCMTEEFRLHWLCMDDETYDQLNSLVNSPIYGRNFFGIRTYKLKDLEEQNSELAIAKSNPLTKFGDAHANYCWSLTPWFVNYVHNKASYNEPTLYIDADIFFYKSPQIIYDTVKNKSVGIHTHRFTPPFKETEVGWYNVGVVYFGISDTAYKMTETWKNWVIHIDNPYYEKYGQTGDQKFLELFPRLYRDETCVFDEYTKITHLAPWCTDIEHSKELVFFHFSHFNYDLMADTWKDSHHGEWNPAQIDHIRPHYENYFNKIKEMSKIIQ